MRVCRGYPKLRVLLFSLFIAAQIDLSTCCRSFKCSDTCSSFENPETNRNFQSIYFEYYKGERKAKGCEKQICCEEGTGGIKALRHGPGCLATKCIDPRKYPNACDAVELKNSRRQPINIELQPIYKETCTLPNGNPGIVNVCCQPGHIEQYLTLGYAAESQEFPHQVRLSMGCGGTIYNDKWIITAAHCLVDDEGITQQANTITVKAGSNIETHASKTYQVREVHVHTNYTKLAKNQHKPDKDSLKFDIAVLKLNQSIEFGPGVKALAIAPVNFNPRDYGDKGIIVGWGRSDNYQSPSLLRKSFIQIREDKECADVYTTNKNFSYQTICVGGNVRLPNGTLDRGVVAGQGDSGGPAICRGEDGNAVLCGITSFGADDDLCEVNRDENCAPSVYASVSHFNPWIVKKAGDQSSPTIQFHTVPFSAQNTQPDDHKYLVQVKSTEGDSCGGTLVSKDTVVTAAHCVYRLDDSGKSHIRKGLKVHSGNDKSSSYKVKHIYTKNWRRDFKIQNKFAILTNPFKVRDVKMLDGYYYDYDIAILKLDREVEDAEPLQLPPDGFNPYGKSMESTEIARNRGRNGEIKKREINLVPKSDCQVRFNAFNFRVTDENTTTILSSESRSQRQAQSQTFELDPAVWAELLRRLGSGGGGQVEGNEVGDGTYEEYDEDDDSGEGNQAPENSNEEIRQWLLNNLDEVRLTPREGCYVEKYSGGSTCDREHGGPVICKDPDTRQEYLCGVQTFRFCLGSFPNIFVDVSQFKNEIEKHM